MTKGIILAGGAGTRLYPMTAVASKQLQPVYDKPMVFYPLSTLLWMGIEEILLISTPEDTPTYEQLIGDGSRFGVRVTYKVQEKPEGIAQAYLLAEEFLQGEPSCLILGDNIFYGDLEIFERALKDNRGCTIFGYTVRDPRAYGVVEMSPSGTVLSLEEKPPQPKSDLAVPGIYMFDGSASERAKQLKLSSRGELEIVDLIKMYLPEKLNAVPLGRGFVWLDAGTPTSMLESSSFIATIEHRASIKIGCPEEAALRKGLMTREEFVTTVQNLPDCPYKKYLESLIK